VLTTLIQQHNGKVLDSPGDNLLAEFVSVVDAVQCAVAVQKEIKAYNDELPENRRMQFRIGINLGDVIQEEERIYGDGVNVAARLEGLAEPGGICISRNVYDQIKQKLNLGYEYLVPERKLPSLTFVSGRRAKQNYKFNFLLELAGKSQVKNDSPL
jgi:adenylate cyclase